jgi:predicted aspartyl protease
LTGPTGLTEAVDLFVDTGASLIVIPRWLAERLELVVRRHQLVSLAGGMEAMWPVAEVRVAIDDQEIPTLCFIAPAGPPLLGSLALEGLFLAVDPVGRRLVPTRGFVLLS